MKTAMVLTGVAAAALWAAGVMAEEGAKQESETAAAAQGAGMRGLLKFEKMDANKDGKVSQEEYLAAMAEMAKVRFAALDTDKDGALTAAELQAGRERRRPEGGKQHRGGEKKTAE